VAAQPWKVEAKARGGAKPQRRSAVSRSPTKIGKILLNFREGLVKILPASISTGRRGESG
jgi:hypothetical protein